MTDLRRLLKASARILRQRPAFAAVIIATLAVAIGSAVAVFAVIDRLFVRPLPFPESQRIAFVQKAWPLFLDGTNGEPTAARPDVFARLASYEVGRASVGATESRVVRVARVSADFFSALGTRTTEGALFSRRDDSDQLTAVITTRLARALLGSDSGATGRTISLNQRIYSVTAVLPPEFAFYHRADEIEVFVPYRDRDRVFTEAQLEGTGVIARLAPNASLPAAQSAVDEVFARIASARPELRLDQNDRMRVIPLQEEWVGSMKFPIFMLLGASACLLLIACANAAGLLLARDAMRRRELAVRVALGADRMQLVREALGEALVLGGLATGAGLLIADFGTSALLALAPTRIPFAGEIGISPRVVLFALAVALPTACVAGLTSALRISRSYLSRALRTGVRGAGMTEARTRQALVVAQVALTVMLLVNAGLLLRSFRALRFENVGFDAHNVMTLEFAATTPRFPDAGARLAYHQQIIERLQALSGVEEVALVNYLPMYSGSLILPVTAPDAQTREPMTWSYRSATPDYFRAMRIPLLAGRSFNEFDRPGTAPVMVIDRSAAAQLGQSFDRVLGRRVVLNLGEPMTFEIVGITDDIRQQGLGIGSYPGFYVSAAQRPPSVVNLVVRATNAPQAMESVRRALQSVDASLPVASLQLLEGRITASVSRRRFALATAGVLGATALLLSIVGLVALMSQHVVHRAQEIGVRVALGARPLDILRLVLAQGGRMALAGALVGILCAIATTRLLGGLLYGVGALDPLTFAVVPAAVIIVAAIACGLPARRALSGSPVVAMRSE